MCGITKRNGEEGVLFRDGTFMPIKDISLGNLTESQRRELEGMHIINEVALRNKLHRLSNDINNLSNKLDQIMDMIEAGKRGGLINKSACPVNEKRIEEISIRATKNWFKDSILTTGNIAKAIMAILAILALMGAVVYGVSEAIK